MVHYYREFLNAVQHLLCRAVHRDQDKYFGNCYGTTSKPLLFLKNLLAPNRFVKRFVYGQIIRLPHFLTLAKKLPGNVQLDEQEREWLAKLRKDGVVVIEGDVIAPSDAVISAYGLSPKNYPNDGGYNKFACSLKLAPVRTLATTDRLLRLVSHYYGAQPYLRHLPKVHVTYPKASTPGGDVGKDYAHNWHFDTPNQLTAMILLDDLSVDQPHLIYAKKSHKLHQKNISAKDRNFSNKTVMDEFEIEPCVGKKGSIVVFDPNGLHKLKVIENASRIHMHLNFVPGNNIVHGEVPTEPLNAINVHSPRLNKLQTESLKFLEN